MERPTPPHRADGAKRRRLGQTPLMRVGKQFCNIDASRYQNTIHKKADAKRFRRGPTTFARSHDGPSTDAGIIRPPAPPATMAPAASSSQPPEDLTLIVMTVASMTTDKAAASRDELPRPRAKSPPTGLKTEPRPTLRANRPLRISNMVNSDIWQTILSYCEPRFLLEAKTLNSAFYRLLSDRSCIWKQSRRNHFGADMPDCPPTLTEQQYVDLLAGRGCQSRNCPREHTDKVYWTFQVRLCVECFRQRVIRADKIPVHRWHPLRHRDHERAARQGRYLWELLPMALSDGRRCRGSRLVDADTWLWADAPGAGGCVFLKSSYLKLEAEYLDLVMRGPGVDAIEAWADDFREKTMAYMITAADIEAWHKAFTMPNTSLHEAREIFFEDKAADLPDPISPSLLHHMAAFRRILKVQAQPTERSWRTLKPKIVPYKWQAQHLEDFRVEMSWLIPTDSHPKIRLFKTLHKHRCGRKQIPCVFRPEQSFVLGLAQTEFARCVAGGVADADLLLVCLNHTFDAYYRLKERPLGLNFDGSKGPYRLSLDDARMIIEEVIEAEVPPWLQRATVVLSSLKCRGCRRTDHVTAWSFTKAFEHMLMTHADVVGDGLQFWQFAVPFPSTCEGWTTKEEETEENFRFPWYTVPWPRSLPLVPHHQDPGEWGDWHPDDVLPYVPLAKDTVSAFEGRAARPRDRPSVDFAENLLYAVEKLNGVWLDGPCQMKVALKYALDLHAREALPEPALSTFVATWEQMQRVNPGMELKFRCGGCVTDPTVVCSARQVKYRIPADELLAHWYSAHDHPGAVWSQAFMHLPSESEILEQIEAADLKLQMEKAAAVKRHATLQKDVRQRPRLKTEVILKARLVREAFDDLFPPSGGSPAGTRDVAQAVM